MRGSIAPFPPCPEDAPPKSDTTVGHSSDSWAVVDALTIRSHFERGRHSPRLLQASNQQASDLQALRECARLPRACCGFISD